MKLLTHLALAGFAVILALCGCVGTNLISGWGLWYSGAAPIREQTDALLAGHLALSESPLRLEYDFAWGAGGVQQVWGLGVAAWRLPFEAAARLFGQAVFPDRIAIAVAWAVMIYLVFLAFMAPAAPGLTWWQQLGRHPERLAAIGVIIFFPPFLNVSHAPFNNYEEPPFYGYIYSVSLFAGSLAFLRRPRFAGLLALCFMSGLVGFLRPPDGCYGLASAVLACWLTRGLKWPWWQTAAGLAGFGLSGGLLFWSNWQRFGSGFEFGHNLNLTNKDLIFTARIGAPFAQEPFWSAFREMLGSLFWLHPGVKEYAYGTDLVRWQSHTIRWREFYRSTFDVSILAGLLLCWGRAGWRWVAARIRGRADTWDSEAYLTAAWAFISLVPLGVFYLRFHAMSARYWLDFSPAFAVAIAGCFLLKWRSSIPGYVARVALIGVFAGWWYWDITNAWSSRSGSAAVDYHRAVKIAVRPQRAVPTLPDTYAASPYPENQTGVYRNGWGWDRGDTAPVDEAVSLFFDSPRKLSVEVGPYPGRDPSEEDYAKIKAKVSLEFLKLESITNTARGKLLVFDGPNHEAYRHGIQLVSLGFILPEEFMHKAVPFRLLQVSCNQSP